MLTRRGWALVCGAVLLAGAGRILGVLELYVLAAGAFALAVAAVASVLLRGRVALEGARRMVPSTVHAGGDSRVEIVIRNRGNRPTPVVMLRDSVEAVAGAGVGVAGAVRQARFSVAPLEPGHANRGAYRLGAERRGVFRVGPLEAAVGDPFGLAAVQSIAAPATELIVYPRIEVVVPPPLTTGHDPRTGGGRATFIGHGDEFYGLRGYEVGDDLRHVHWPSTARQDDLMIRQNEVPWQGRATILLDVRDSAHNDDSFETAVSAAASLLTSCWHRDTQVRIITTDGLDSGFGVGTSHLHAAMEHLAVVERGDDSLRSLTGALRRRATGALAVITTSAPAGPLEQLVATPGAYGWVALVVVARRPGETRPVPAAGVLVPVDAGASFADAWNRAVVRPATAASTR